MRYELFLAVTKNSSGILSPSAEKESERTNQKEKKETRKQKKKDAHHCTVLRLHETNIKIQNRTLREGNGANDSGEKQRVHGKRRWI